MKILITTDWYETVIKGVVTSVVNLSNELKKRGHEVKILTLSRNHYFSPNAAGIPLLCREDPCLVDVPGCMSCYPDG